MLGAAPELSPPTWRLPAGGTKVTFSPAQVATARREEHQVTGEVHGIAARRAARQRITVVGGPNLWINTLGMSILEATGSQRDSETDDSVGVIQRHPRSHSRMRPARILFMTSSAATL